MDVKNIAADFQLIKSRVIKFNYETKPAESFDGKVNIECDIDYDVKNFSSDEEMHKGTIELYSSVKGKCKNTIVFSILHKMEGMFHAGTDALDEESFRNMLELNGTSTLLQLGRAYILSASALLGLNPPIRIPMINVYQLKKLKDKSSEKKGGS